MANTKAELILEKKNAGLEEALDKMADEVIIRERAIAERQQVIARMVNFLTQVKKGGIDDPKSLIQLSEDGGLQLLDPPSEAPGEVVVEMTPPAEPSPIDSCVPDSETSKNGKKTGKELANVGS